ncbi:MAG: hypothetical protein QXR26_04930 [Candidatus Caldarchaeum sp.]
MYLRHVFTTLSKVVDWSITVELSSALPVDLTVEGVCSTILYADK